MKAKPDLKLSRTEFNERRAFAASELKRLAFIEFKEGPPENHEISIKWARERYKERKIAEYEAENSERRTARLAYRLAAAATIRTISQENGWDEIQRKTSIALGDGGYNCVAINYLYAAAMAWAYAIGLTARLSLDQASAAYSVVDPNTLHIGGKYYQSVLEYAHEVLGKGPIG